MGPQLPVSEQLAEFVLLVMFAALFVNVARGTARSWLRAKFIGDAHPATVHLTAPTVQNPRAGGHPGERPT